MRKRFTKLKLSSIILKGPSLINLNVTIYPYMPVFVAPTAAHSVKISAYTLSVWQLKA